MDKQTAEMYKMYERGETMEKIGLIYGMSKQVVSYRLASYPLPAKCYEAVCPICNQPFTRKPRNKKYCSPRCGRRMRLHGVPFPPEDALLVRHTKKIAPPDANGCWLWVGHRNPVSQYGRLGWRGSIAYAHRWMWRMVYGEIPKEMHVLHKCDNPPCVNPAHLWLGTHADNMRDREAKRRGPYERRKLSEDDARACKTRHKAGESCPSLARGYSVSASVIYALISGKTYKNVKRP